MEGRAMAIMKSANGTFKRVLATTLIAACCAGGVTTVSAAPQSDQFSDIDCSKEQESMLGMKVCAGRELAKTEKELKAQRQKMLKAADKDMRKSMNKWFKASDAYADAIMPGSRLARPPGAYMTISKKARPM